MYYLHSFGILMKKLNMKDAGVIGNDYSRFFYFLRKDEPCESFLRAIAVYTPRKG